MLVLSIGYMCALKHCNAMEGLHSNWRAQAKYSKLRCIVSSPSSHLKIYWLPGYNDQQGATGNNVASQSSISQSMTRIVHAPVTSGEDGPSDLVRRTKDVHVFFFFYHVEADGDCFRCKSGLPGLQHHWLPLAQRAAWLVTSSACLGATKIAIIESKDIWLPTCPSLVVEDILRTGARFSFWIFWPRLDPKTIHSVPIARYMQKFPKFGSMCSQPSIWKIRIRTS